MDVSNIEINHPKQLTQAEQDSQLIEAKANLDDVNQEGDSALILAAYQGDADNVRLLIQAKVNLNLTNDVNNTALIAATLNGHIDIVRLLIQANANLDTINQSGDTSLSCAIWRRNIDIAYLLFNAMTTKQVHIEINLHPHLNIQAHFDNFTQAVIAHRMAAFKILGPLVFDKNQNNIFSSLPRELMELIAYHYVAVNNKEVWHAHQVELDAAVICNAFNALSFTPSFTGQTKGHPEEDNNYENKEIVIKKSKLI